MKLSDYLEHCGSAGKRLSDSALELEAREQKCSEEDAVNEMAARFQIMRQSARRGLESTALSSSGLSGRNASTLKSADLRVSLLGGIGRKAMLYALAISEENARMGKIVAAPTAGACGILPAVVLALGEELGISEDRLVMSLFTAGAVGRVIAGNATLAGAEGGCQAECGSAAAMAAAAAAELLDGTPQVCAHAAALALKSMLGLVCDPVCGLVEVPCVKRNATGAISALAAANLALAGIESVIPADEVIEAMGRVGKAIPAELRETSKGGLAATPTAQKLSGSLRG